MNMKKLVFITSFLLYFSFVFGQTKDNLTTEKNTTMPGNVFYVDFSTLACRDFIEILKANNPSKTDHLITTANKAPKNWIQKRDIGFLISLIDSKEPTRCIVENIASTLPFKDSATMGGYAMDLIDAFRLHKTYPFNLTSCPKNDSTRQKTILQWWDKYKIEKN
ncbi:MAG: hypothetical protein DI598_06155 [Pseudopedobacter saltans]|uniref:Uncharacterized protein n=1 Tax=Pseudopedobacter saltans TaxID=151895 RepID=A0A2W5F7G5_9SPHI|nr:MAG: hypothetical protein DI598_06155 [Pseudopedobacter saltans]